MEEKLKKLLKDIVINNKNLDIRYKLIIEAMDLAIQLGYDVGIGTDNKNPGVAVVYIDLPTGQISWHMPNEFDNWDGHSTDEKFQRIKKYIKSKVGVKMSRLKKIAVMNIEMFKGTLSQLGDKGRDILKGIEDYKFALEQAARIVANDQELTQRLIEKKKALDQAAGQIYSIVFEIENIDITQEYQEQQDIANNPELKQNVPDGNAIPNIPNQNNATPPSANPNVKPTSSPAEPNAEENNGDENKNSDSKSKDKKDEKDDKKNTDKKDKDNKDEDKTKK